MDIFRFEFKRLFKSCLIWSLICSILMILFMLLFPSMENIGIKELISTELDVFPEGLLETFGLDKSVDFSDILQYLAYSIQYISMATAIYGFMLGINSLLQEETEGTIEFLYAQPVSRYEIVKSKVLSRLLIFCTLIVIIGIFTMGISIMVRSEDIDILNMTKMVKNILIGILFVGVIFLTIGFFLSTILKPSTNSTSISIGIFFITYLLGVISKIKDNLKFLKFFSPFDYALPMDIVRDGWSFKYIITGIVIIVISTFSTYIIYRKRDFKI